MCRSKLGLHSHSPIKYSDSFIIIEQVSLVVVHLYGSKQFYEKKPKQQGIHGHFFLLLRFINRRRSPKTGASLRLKDTFPVPGTVKGPVLWQEKQEIAWPGRGDYQS